MRNVLLRWCDERIYFQATVGNTYVTNKTCLLFACSKRCGRIGRRNSLPLIYRAIQYAMELNDLKNCKLVYIICFDEGKSAQ